MSTDAGARPLWRSKTARRLLKLALALVVLRLLLAAFTPLALHLAARSAGLELEYSSSRTSLSSGQFELRDARLRPRREGDAPAPLLAHLGRLELDLDLASMLRGKLHVPRAQLDGLELWVEIDRAGQCAWSDLLRSSSDSPPPPQEDVQPLSFELPLDVSAQLLRARLHVRDASVGEPLALDLQADARVEARDGRGDAVVWLSAGGALRQARVEANFETQAQRARAGLRASFDGLTPDAVRGWLARAGWASRESLHGSLEGRVELAVRPGPGASIEGRAVLRDVQLSGADGPHFTLGALEVQLDELSAERLALRRVAVLQPRVWAQWNALGAPEWAGLSRATKLNSHASVAAPHIEENRAEHVATTPSKLRFELAQLVLAQGALEVRDAAEPHHAPLELLDAQLELAGLQWPPDGATTIEFAARTRAPGVASLLKLDARAELAQHQLALDAKLHSDGVTLERLAPTLARVGLESELREGSGGATLRANLDWSAGLGLDAALLNVRWSDGEELFRLERAALNGANVAGPRVNVRQIECVGLQTSARRGRDGRIRALGFALAPSDAPPQSAPSTAPTSTSSNATGAAGTSQAAPSSFSLDALAVRGASFEWLDEVPQEAVRLALRDAELDLEQLDLGEHVAPRKAQLRAACKADPLFTQARVELQLAASKEKLLLAGETSVDALDLTPLAPYLAQAGLAPRLADGRLRARVNVEAERADAPWSLTAQVLDAELDAGGERLAGVERIALDGLALRELTQGLEFRTLTIERPFVRVERSAAGTIALCGVELSPPVGRTVESSPTPSTHTAPSWLPFSSRADSLTLREGRVELHDAFVASTAPLVVGFDAALAPLALGAGPTPTLGRIGISLEGACELAELQFQAHATPSSLALIAELNAAGLASGPLHAYLPSGVSLALENGAARAKLRASAQRGADGALLATLELDDAALLDSSGAAEVALERARGEVRLASDGAVEVRELRALGVRASVEREPSGATRVAGLRIASATDENSSTQPPTTQDERSPADAGAQTSNSAAPPTTSDAASPVATAPADAAQRDSSDLPRRRAVSAPPRVVVGDLELELRELTLRGFAGEPLTLALRAEHSGPRTWLAPTLDGAQDIELALRGSLAPVCGDLQLALRASPCATQPQFALEFALRELNGASFARLAPALAERIDASELAHGELSGRLRAQFELRRTTPLELDFAAPLGFEAALEQLAFRADPQGELLAGLRALRVEGGVLEARARRLRIASLELDTPQLRATRDAQALRVLGVRVLQSPPSAPAAPANEVEADHARTAAPAPFETPSFDVVVERTVATGLDVEFIDLSGPTPARLPLDELDAELKRVSLAGLARGDALSFRATLGAGAVELPPRISADSLLEGMAAGVVDLLDGENNAAASEPRPLFAELNLSGKLALAPAPRGWAALNLEALELPAFRGPALATGLELGDGTADIDVRLRLAGADGMSIDARSSFAHLSLSEPADGPLARYLSLPAPLDTVLFLLKDAEGLHKFNLGFRVERDGLSTTELAGAAASAAGGVIARAVASSPLRLLSTLTDAAGLTGDEPPPQSTKRVVEFAAGDPTLDARGRAALARIGEDVRGRPRKRVIVLHELSRADFERVARLVNPSLDDRERLAARLRERKAELTRERESLAARARSEFALAEPSRRAELLDRLRSLDAQIGEGENALERLFELSRPGSERRGATRARGAAIALGAERADRARRALAELGVEAERVIVRVVKADTLAELEAGGRLTLWAQ